LVHFYVGGVSAVQGVRSPGYHRGLEDDLSIIRSETTWASPHFSPTTNTRKHKVLKQNWLKVKMPNGQFNRLFVSFIPSGSLTEKGVQCTPYRLNQIMFDFLD